MIELSKPQFARLVRDALTNLYDPARIETHPLLDVLVDARAPHETRGLRLREVLIGAIERLQPTEAIPFGRPEWLSYRIMQLRYIEAQRQSEIYQELGLSHSTYYRYHKEAAIALVNILWEQAQAVILDRHTNQGANASEDSGPDRARKEAASVARSLHRQWVDLGDLLAGVRQTLAPFAEQEEFTFQIETPPMLPAVYTDPAVLRQILLTVLAEASRFASAGTLHLSIQMQENTLAWQLRGLIEASLCEQDIALSVGFAASQSLAQGCGGRLWLQTGEEGDLVIWCSIPNSRPKSILIIDDNPDTIRLYQRYLQERDYEVIAAESAEAVRDRLAEAHPDLIMLDVLMPNEDGWNILQSLKISPETAAIPVVICSVLSQPRLALTLGAQAVLQKPVDQETLVQTIETLLEIPDNRAIAHPAAPEGTQSP